MTLNWTFFPVGEFGAHQHQWQEINLAGAASPLLSSRFVTPLIEQFADGNNLIAVCSDDGVPVAMTILEKSGPGKWETFQPSQAPLGLLVKQVSISIEILLRSLMRSIPGIPLVVGVSGQDPDLLPRPAATGNLKTLDFIQTARVLINGSFEEYWKTRDGKLRQETSRRLKRACATGIEPRLELVTDVAAVAAGIEDFGRLESAGWKSKEGTAVHANNKQGHFYRSLLESFCSIGKGRIYRYWLGENLAAMQLCVEAERTLVFLKTTYDENLKSHAPGILMQYEIMRGVFTEGTTAKVEFYGRTGEPQAKWCDNQIRTMYHLNYYRWSLLPKVRGILAKQPMESSAAAAPASTSEVILKQAAHEWQLVPAADFGKHIQAWQSVYSQTANSPVLEASFVASLLSVFSRGDELVAICGDANLPAAVAILCRTGAFRWQTFQPSQAPLGLWLHRPGLTWEQLLPGLMAILPGIPLVLGISQKNPEIYARPTVDDRMRTLDFARTARILVNRPFDAYWQARTKTVRRQVERRLKRLRELGLETSLEAITDPAAMHGAVEEFGRIESAGWKGKLGTAIHIDNIQGTFYSSMLQDYCKRGRGVVYRYRFNNTTVAMELCICSGDTLIMLKTTYDETYKAHGPGILMRHAIFQCAFADPLIRKIEFLGKIQSWQTNWCDEIYSLYHLNFYRWPWLAKMEDLRRSLRQRLERSAPASDGEDSEPGAVGSAPAIAHGPTHVVTRYDDLSALPGRYEPLFNHAGKTSLFHTLPWYQNFIRSVLEPHDRLRIYAVDTAAKPGKARAVLLMEHRRGSLAGLLGARTLSGLSNYYTSLFGPVIEPGAGDAQKTLDAIAAEITGDEHRWDVIDLHPLAAEAPTFPGLIAAFTSAGLLVRTYFCFGNWYLPVRGRCYAEYFETLPAQLKNTIRRKRKQLESSGKSRIVVYRDKTEIDEALRAYERIYAASWKSQEAHPEFIRGLCYACADSGWLRLGVVYFDDQPIAAQIWIVSGGIAAIYKLAYDNHHARLSAGSILSAHLMEHVIDVDKVREVDYLSGDDAYKRHWMSDRRERWGIVAFNLRTPRGLLAASLHFGGRAAKRAWDFTRRLGRSGA